jgi:carboxymethylenebutenolidase
VIEEEIEVHMTGGTSEGILYSPEGGRRWPGVIHLTDIGGIRPAHRQMAGRLAAEGYTVLMPNVFYRTGHPPVFDFKPSMGGDERTTKGIAELTGPLTPAAVEQDASNYIDFLAARASTSAGAMDVVGYCATGGMALRIAAARPDRIRGGSIIPRSQAVIPTENVRRGGLHF